MATVSSVRLGPPLGEVPLTALPRPLCDLVKRGVHRPLAVLALTVSDPVEAAQFVQLVPPDAEVRSDCIRWHPGIPHAAKLFDVWHQSFARGMTTPVQSPHRKTTAL
jgi:hypothetical protein